MRPHLYLKAQSTERFRSVADVRTAIRAGRCADHWREIVAKVEGESTQTPWTPATPHPLRSAGNIKHRNREFEIVGLTANRIRDGALVALLTADRPTAGAVLAQVRCLYDETAWPELEDITHLRCGDHCSLRRGQLAFALGVAYDWLHPLLTAAERADYIAGFNRRLTAAFRQSLDAGDRYTRWNNNFVSTIYGGFAIAAMGFGADNPYGEWLRQVCFPRMDAYCRTLFGPAGEFPETVQYAGSAAGVAHYLMARWYDGSSGDPFSRVGFDRFCRWYIHCTLPPGRVIGFGDNAADMPPTADYFAAVAAAQRDPLFQWFYLNYAGCSRETHRKRSLEILYDDPTLPARSPSGILPLGCAFHEHAKIVVSRARWDPRGCPSVVYAKADREQNHSHADWGQVCMDGFGERLLIDLGSTKGYPLEAAGHYYNYQQVGHNVLMIGPAETCGTPLGDRERHGAIMDEIFDDTRGGAWSFDLSPVYALAKRVRRTVIHLLPRVAVVFDAATTERDQPFSLRWHPGAQPEIVGEGGFFCRVGQATLSGWTARLDGDAVMTLERHAYRAPYDRDRLGEPYRQIHEPYIELSARTHHWRSLGLFAAFGPGEMRMDWRRVTDGWQIDTPEGPIAVAFQDSRLTVGNSATGHAWTLDGRQTMTDRLTLGVGP